ncbi:MAG: hypothetical protein IPH31_10655 [Lewinellaceae bacterium]|nr:hypothetical protein [Lewinellaceae bacterium]
MKIFLLLVYTLLTSSIFAQEQDTCYCYIQKKHFPLPSLIYENKADTIVKIYHKNLGLVDCSLLNMASFENANRTDTISLEKSLDKVLDENDHLVKPEKFMPLRLKDYGKASDIILFEKRIDFMGDKAPDKMEIRTRHYENRDQKPYELHLYENKSGKLVLLFPNILLWEKPLKMYISNVRYMNRATLMFICESEDPEHSQSLYLVSAYVMKN